MTDENISPASFLQTDDRYPIDAYMFVRDGLTYAVEVLQMGQQPMEGDVEDSGDSGSAAGLTNAPDSELDEMAKQHSPMEALGEFGIEHETEMDSDSSDPVDSKSGDADAVPVDENGERHLTGQQLCEALRRYAIHQYGFMARIVLSNWGVHQTSDFGEIVYNMIKAGWMKKSERDRKDHFNDVYDFSEAFEQQFQINQAAIYWPS